MSSGHDGFPVHHHVHHHRGKQEQSMRATWNGTVLAESDDTVVVEGNHYFPPGSVRWDLLTASDTRTRCAWKGEARYWSVPDEGRAGTDVAWVYLEPSDAARDVAGHVAFWRGVRVEPSDGPPGAA